MANSIEFAKNYTGILDEVYQRAAVSRCLNSGGAWSALVAMPRRSSYPRSP